MSRNPLSAIGRMSYTVHLAFYPSVLFLIEFFGVPYYKRSNELKKKQEYEGKPKARKVDPDLFNPFTPIPYHNNPELKYAFAGVRMQNYLDAHSQINEKEYFWKDYHNSFDHNHTNGYMYNWVSMHDNKH